MNTNESDSTMMGIMNSSGRRDFLKKGGGASVATMLALHGTKSELLASGSANPPLTCGVNSAGNMKLYGSAAVGAYVGEAKFIASADPSGSPRPILSSGVIATSLSDNAVAYNTFGGVVPICGGTGVHFSATDGLLTGDVQIASPGSFIPQTAYGCNLNVPACERAYFGAGYLNTVVFSYDTQVTVADTVWVWVKAFSYVFLHTGISVAPHVGTICDRTGFASSFTPAYDQPYKINSAALTPAGQVARPAPATIYLQGCPSFDPYGCVISGSMPAGYSFSLPYRYNGTGYDTVKLKLGVIFDRSLGSAPIPAIAPTAAPAGAFRYGPPIGRYGLVISGKSHTIQTLNKATGTHAVAAGDDLIFDSVTGFLSKVNGTSV